MQALTEYAIIDVQKAIFMLFFNLKTLEEQSCNDTKKFIEMLYFHWSKDPLTKYKQKHQSKVSLAGGSYLLNPAALFADKTTDPLYKVQYIKLAGMRDYLLWKQYGFSGLQRSYYPDLAIDNISHNPLLKITKTEVQFKYEQKEYNGS